MDIRVWKEHDAILPRYASEGAAGADLHACLDAPVSIAPGKRALIPTGLFLEIPQGCMGEVRPRSGLALRAGVTVLNAPGTIDSDYRGEVKVILVNLGEADYVVSPGDRIAQLVITRYCAAAFVEDTKLSSTARNDGGFGSTGR